MPGLPLALEVNAIACPNAVKTDCSANPIRSFPLNDLHQEKFLNTKQRSWKMEHTKLQHTNFSLLTGLVTRLLSCLLLASATWK